MKFVNTAGETVAPPANRVIQQVWFAGMHSNVGGGYPQDQLAHLPLLWMMEKAAADDGLRFNTNLWAEYRQAADVSGRMYDSRSGTGLIYRYRPRDLTVLCAAGGLTKPTLHEAVLKRIKHHAAAYAPTGVPAIYDVVPANTSLGLKTDLETNPNGRRALHDQVDDYIWLRRGLYLFSLTGLVLLLWLMWSWADAEVAGTTTVTFDCGCERVIAKLVEPLIDIGAWAIPSYFEPGWKAFKSYPSVFCSFIGFFGTAIWSHRRLSKRMTSIGNRGWAIGFSTAAPQQQYRRSPVSWIRQLKASNLVADLFHYWIAPYGLLLLTLWGIGYILLARWFLPAFGSNWHDFITSVGKVIGLTCK